MLCLWQGHHSPCNKSKHYFYDDILSYYLKVDKLHNAILSAHKMSDTVSPPPVPLQKTKGLPSTRCLYCWDRRSVLHRLQSVHLTSVTSAQSTNECLLASVIALVGSWKILLHTPLDPPTARTAASNLPERWQVAQEVAVLFHSKASTRHGFDSADTPRQIMTSSLRRKPSWMVEFNKRWEFKGKFWYKPRFAEICFTLKCYFTCSSLL